MKHVLNLSDDIVISTKFDVPSTYNKETGKNEVDWTNKEEYKAFGSEVVQHIDIYVPLYDNQGYKNGQFQKLSINRSDFLTIAKRIEEIEAKIYEGTVVDDLPF